ncbi:MULTISPECIES: EspA/EspE family type VII secretion system effector [Mycolicibacterium]|uniref:ESX-1 secretion-associated protein A, EspA n=1 Tax=Mycolicibacterium senegalense TaxID=1796 RepID=A0A378W6X8_9MYCO|nr:MULTISPECIES: EspA/EspE family type VII secretion system effector [Mycolicibacterium]MCV7336897.1 hypothetical protein [Mycolicibacterium senegalense]MDR7287596.1 hypothetical protein [Mycolicibacterium senegalense]QZA24634.1 hypothetical protein K3U95_00450 [Mycolicibacterium senegalense]CDP87131.1 ESX-1 secretion-associated protein A, EspA [Mycolicibacterium farcinogenes]SUA28825.1 ESX-1 secretion-associated protein A, EspA [Mycolicibacterium senegalense]
MSKLEQAVEIVEIGFAGKGFSEHWRAKDKPEDAGLARAGLVADGIGGAQMLGELAADKLGGVSPTNFSSYGAATKRIQGFGTPIIGAALLALNGMQVMCGVEDPETGDRFTQGSHNFTAIGDTLKRATPTDQWYGRGSHTYADQNDRQQERVATMAKIDASVKDIVAEQAKQIKQTRDTLDAVATSLTICIPIAIVIGKIPPTGPANQMAFEIGAVAAAMPIAHTMMARMLYLASSNAQKFTQAGSAYREVAAGARPSGAPPASVSPPGGNTTSEPWSPSGGSATGTGTGSINV